MSKPIDYENTMHSEQEVIEDTKTRYPKAYEWLGDEYELGFNSFCPEWSKSDYYNENNVSILAPCIYRGDVLDTWELSYRDITLYFKKQDDLLNFVFTRRNDIEDTIIDFLSKLYSNNDDVITLPRGKKPSDITSYNILDFLEEFMDIRDIRKTKEFIDNTRGRIEYLIDNDLV